jgi:hypothetical protein
VPRERCSDLLRRESLALFTLRVSARGAFSKTFTVFAGPLAIAFYLASATLSASPFGHSALPGPSTLFYGKSGFFRELISSMELKVVVGHCAARSGVDKE